VVLEVVQLVTGHQTAIHHSILVVCNLALTEETSEWATTVVTHTDLTDSTVTVSIMKVDQQVLHSSELSVFPTDKDSAGCVVVVGQFHTDMVVKVQTVTTVVDVVDKADKVDLDLLRSHTSKPNKKICQKRVIDPLFL
tara:strand:+ start:1494 stop:1907 length:414 start_codon:yes stop_codon:yes gene_type:complete